MSFLACCASNALPASVRGYTEVMSGFKSTFFRESRLIASAKHPGVYLTVPVAQNELVEDFDGACSYDGIVPLMMRSFAVTRKRGTEVNCLPNPA